MYICLGNESEIFLYQTLYLIFQIYQGHANQPVIIQVPRRVE